MRREEKQIKIIRDDCERRKRNFFDRLGKDKLTVSNESRQRMLRIRQRLEELGIKQSGPAYWAYTGKQ